MENKTRSLGTNTVFNRHKLAILSVVIAALALPAYADRGSSAFKKGQKAEQQANYDAAVAFYKQACDLTPGNSKYMAAYTKTRFSAAAGHVHKGQLLRDTGALKDAIEEFQRAVDIDSSSFIAQQELRRTADMLRRKEQPKPAPKGESPLAKWASDISTEMVQLRPLSTAPITLHMSATTDVAYKTICKLAGINVLIDPDYRAQKLTIELNDVTLREALDMVRLQSKTFWRPVSSNTIFVTTDSAAKRKELEQNVMKTFYLRNVSTPNELQEAANVLRQLLDVSRIQLLQGQDALIVRGTMDQLVLAEKLLGDIDKPKAEVVIDIAVMQVSRDRIRTLGATVPTTATIGYLGPGGGSTGGSGGGYVLHLGTFGVSVPGASYTALASDSKTKVLQSPQIRTLNDEKATLRIGDRVPIATGSFSTSVIGAGSVNTQFQYLDVGVNIDITPHINENEVTLKMALEISSLNGSENIGGITQPIIGQRRMEHEIRVADGEMNLMGGILQDTETQSLSGYPWISKLPILRYFFAQDQRERNESEIVFAITPHIVRSHDVNDENLRVVEVGTGSSIELRHNPPPPPATASLTAPAKAAGQVPAPATAPRTEPVAAPKPSNSN